MSPAMPAVSVVIPAYNASATLLETVRSVQAQTLTDFEVIIVNDGSRDDTAEIAEDLRRHDERLRVISTSNGGVAAARNTGIEAARAEIVAPMDADDIWHPWKLARQVAALRSDPNATLAYVSRRDIDERSLVLKTNTHALVEGCAPHQMTAYNAVGNGSAIAFRRADALRLGGYCRRLRELGVQGCEDYLLQIRLAAIGKVVADPLYLVGYRKRTGAMSGNDFVMLRSRLKALEMAATEFPELTPTMWETYRKFQFLLGLKLLGRMDPWAGVAVLGDWLSHAGIPTIRNAIGFMVHRQQTRDPVYDPEGNARRHFTSFAPDEEDNDELTGHMRRMVAHAARRDEAWIYPSAHLPNAITG